MKIINFLVFVLFITTTELLLAIPMENELNPNAALSRPSSSERGQITHDISQKSMKGITTDSDAVIQRSTKPVAIGEDADESSDSSAATSNERWSDLSFTEQQPVSELLEQELLDKAAEQKRIMNAYCNQLVTASSSQRMEEQIHLINAVSYPQASAKQYENAAEYLKRIRESSFSATLDFAELLKKASKQAQIAAIYHTRALESFESGKLNEIDDCNFSEAASYRQFSAEHYAEAAEYLKQAIEAPIAGVSLSAANFNEAFKQAKTAAEHYVKASIFLESGQGEDADDEVVFARSAARSAKQYVGKAVSFLIEKSTGSSMVTAEQEVLPTTKARQEKSVKFSNEIETDLSQGSFIKKAASTYGKARQVITPEFILARAKKITSRAKIIEKQAEKALEALEGTDYYGALYEAIHSCNNIIQAAHQTTAAWIQTAKMYSIISGPQLGSRLKNTWSKKTNDWKEQRNELIQELLTKAEEVSDKGTMMIEDLYKDCDILNEAKNYNKAYQLSDAYGKIIAARNAVTLAGKDIRSHLEELSRDSLFSSSVVLLSFDHHLVLLTNMAIEAVEKTVQDAELVRQKVMDLEVKELSEQRKGKPSQSSTLSELGCLSVYEPQEEMMNRQFKHRAETANSYATKMLDTVHDVFSYFTIDGELGDQTDVNELSHACDKLEAMMIVLSTVKEKTGSSPADFLFTEKQLLAINNVENSTQYLNSVAQRIREYPQDNLTRKILANLQKIESEYKTSLDIGK